MLGDPMESRDPMPVRPMRHSAQSIAVALGNPAPTAEQLAVIQAPMRPLLVVAGAGSGKTETMASRVVWLVANGYVEPDQVLGLTFTRKAATELAERIGRRLRRLRHVGMWTPSQELDGAEVLGGTPTTPTPVAWFVSMPCVWGSSPSHGCCPRRLPGSLLPRWSSIMTDRWGTCPSRPRP